MLWLPPLQTSHVAENVYADSQLPSEFQSPVPRVFSKAFQNLPTVVLLCSSVLHVCIIINIDYAYKIYNRSYNYMLFQACNQKENKRELCHISHAGDEKVG